MIEYIYFVKCPNCEDEPFTFFDKAKQAALGRMSEKPIITQIEVTRNDFGECTDSCDLGTVWSWEDMMTDTEKETADESALLTKDFLNSLDPENDPEFATIDNSVDFEPATSEVSALDDLPDNFCNPIESKYDELAESSINKFVIVGEKEDYSKQFYNIESEEWVAKSDDATLFDDRNEAIVTLSDLDTSEFYTTRVMIKPVSANESISDNFRKPIPEGTRVDPVDSTEAIDRKLRDLVYNSVSGPIADRVGSSGFYSENGQRFMTIPVSTSSDSYDFDSYKKDLKQVFPNTDIYCMMDDNEIIIDVTDFYSKGKPIPEGMTIEQLVEEMEENEDTVECTWCNDLFDKDQCRKEVDLGWLCGRCEAAIKSRGETLTFKENNYWDFLDESVEDARTLEELVKDSINHLTSDLGKDPWADDFVDDVIADIERNYASFVPEDFDKYQEWCSAVACEVSRQVNRADYKLEELEEAADYRNHLTLCPECGSEQGFDKETGICIECGFNFEGI